jgi:hypothetical protein
MVAVARKGLAAALDLPDYFAQPICMQHCNER